MFNICYFLLNLHVDSLQKQWQGNAPGHFPKSFSDRADWGSKERGTELQSDQSNNLLNEFTYKGVQYVRTAVVYKGVSTMGTVESSGHEGLRTLAQEPKVVSIWPTAWLVFYVSNNKLSDFFH